MRKVREVIDDCFRKERSARLHIKGTRLCVPEVFSAMVMASELDTRAFWSSVALGASVHWAYISNENERYRVTCAYMLRGLSENYPLPDVVDSKNPWGVTEIALLDKSKFTIPNYLYVPLKKMVSARRLSHEVSLLVDHVTSELGKRHIFVSKSTVIKKVHVMLMAKFIPKDMRNIKINI
jgi:hypothetical protein